MRKIQIKILALFLLCVNFAFADITTIHSFNEMDEHLKKADKHTLIVFDIDDVLIAPNDLVLRPSSGPFQPASWDKLSDEQILELVSIMLSKTKFDLIDTSIPSKIKSLQERSIKTIALTAARTGKFFVIPNMEDWRIHQLLHLGIDFSSAFPKTKTLAFPELNIKENPPLFKRGILFLGDYYSSDKSTKGDLLNTFLNKIDWIPKKVIFIDDKMDNVFSVEEAMKKQNIEFYGFLYKGAEALPDIFDPQIATLQFDHLAEKEWLSDVEARNHLPQLAQENKN